MPDTGLILAGTGANLTGVGTIAWVDPTRITANDNSDASASALGAFISNYLRASNFGLSIPAGAIIDGIEVRLERYEETGSDNVFDEFVRLVDDTGTVRTTNKANTTSEWSTSRTLVNYGGANDLWGEAPGFWTPAKLNDVDFGWAIAIDKQGALSSFGGRIDAMWVRVFYTEGSDAVSAGVATVTGVGQSFEADSGEAISAGMATIAGIGKRLFLGDGMSSGLSTMEAVGLIFKRNTYLQNRFEAILIKILDDS